MLWIPVLGQVPKSKVDAVTETIHGIRISDPYRWLEDQNSPATREWIEQQMQYTQSLIAKLPMRDKLRDRLKELSTIERVSMPVERGGRYFFMRRSPGQDQAVVTMRQGLHGKDEALIDPNPMSPEHTTSAVMLNISDDGKLMVWGKREGGEDEVTPSLFDVDARATSGESLPKARYMGMALTRDKSALYYSKHSNGSSRVYVHRLGADAAQDKMIFGEGYGPEYGISARLDDGGKYLLITVELGSAGTKTEIFVKNLSDEGPIRPVIKGIKAHFDAEIGGDTLFVRTNWNAPNGRVLAIDLLNPAEDRWREIVPERSYNLEDLSLAGGKVGLSYLESVHSRIEIVSVDGKPVRQIQLPGLGSASGPLGRWHSPIAVIRYASFAQPQILYDYNVETGSMETWHATQAPFKPKEIEVEQVWYVSKDKTKVPMFLVHKKGMPRDGNRPVFLTAYGGFNISLTPEFQATAALWAEMGGLFAVPNLRGGGEFGEKWHRAGMFANKQNVFDDFISAAEYLVSAGYTKPSRIGIEGGSNGGLLVGAAMTQRPDLFGAVVCAVPLLDMIRYQNFKIAKFWVSEYGSSDDAEQFHYIYKYSPYHNVKKGVKYPAVLFVSGDSDTRVDPLHARKMTALMQASTGSDRPVLLHYDVKGGHSAGLPVTRQVENEADALAFMVWQLNGGKVAPVPEVKAR